MIWDDDQNVQQNKLQQDAADKRLFILILPQLSRNPTPTGQKETINEVKDKLPEVNEQCGHRNFLSHIRFLFLY